MNREKPDDERRRVKDGNRVWTVYEHSTMSGVSSLIFDCGETFRRMRTFPAGWTELSDRALLALCHAPVSRMAMQGGGEPPQREIADPN